MTLVQLVQPKGVSDVLLLFDVPCRCSRSSHGPIRLAFFPAQSTAFHLAGLRWTSRIMK